MLGFSFFYAFVAIQSPTALAHEFCYEPPLQDIVQQITRVSQPVIPNACLQVDQLQLDRKLEKKQAQRTLFNQCESELLSRCFPNLKPEIQNEQLNRLYSDLTANPLFRSQDPAGQCERRAYLISKILAEHGVQSERIYIRAPTIIGKLVDQSGRPIGPRNYLWHAVTTVRVKNRSGSTQRMILDPQFSAAPMPLEEYFRMVTGQTCQEGAAQARTRYDYTCTYERTASNYRDINSEGGPFPSAKSLNESCGWSAAPEFTRLIGRTNSRSPEQNQSDSQFRVDPQLGWDRSALSWGLNILRHKAASRQRLLQERLAHATQPSQVETLKDELRQTEAVLADFEKQRKRILQLE